MSSYAKARSHLVTENASRLRATPSASCRKRPLVQSSVWGCSTLISREGWAQVSSIKRVPLSWFSRRWYVAVLSTDPHCKHSDTRVPLLFFFFFFWKIIVDNTFDTSSSFFFFFLSIGSLYDWFIFFFFFFFFSLYIDFDVFEISGMTRWLRPGFLDFFACWRFRQFSVRVKIFFLIFVLVVRWFVDFEGFFFYGFDLWVGLNVSFIVGWWPWNGFRFRWKRWLGLVIELWRLGICSGWESGYLRFVSNVQILIFF